MIKEMNYFNIHQIADSGQTFRWYSKDGGYVVVAHHGVILIKQSLNRVTIRVLKETSKDWWTYLGINDDHDIIMSALLGKDDYLDEAIQFGDGIRILKQDPFEMIVTFIISANNNIKRITSAIQLLSEKYGDFLVEFDGVKYYDFPTPKQLKHVTIEDYRQCGLGYRDKYLYRLIQDITTGFDVYGLESLSDVELKSSLLRLMGVGEKVANCIMLFGYDRQEGFPIDTWIKKVLLANYPVKENDLQTFAETYFRPYGGIAQQYLFYYGRMKKD